MVKENQGAWLGDDDKETEVYYPGFTKEDLQKNFVRMWLGPTDKYMRCLSISFQTFLVWTFKIVIGSWKFSILLLYILWDDWPIFLISGSKEQLHQQLEYILLKPACHSWWISKMPSGRQDISEERYAIKFCFKLGKKVTETYEMLQTAFRPSCMKQASVFEWYKRFKEGRESVRDDERCGRSKEVNTPELTHKKDEYSFVCCNHV